MSEIKIRGLTLAQEKAANLMASGKKTNDKAIAKSIGIKLKMLEDWKKDPKFKVRVLQIFDNNVDLERTYRSNRINMVLKPVYKEIRKRLKEDNYLDNLSFKDLLRIMTQLHAELRVDGAVDKRYLTDGIREYGEDNKNERDDDYSGEYGDDLSQMSLAYEDERAAAINKRKVVSLR